MASDPLVKIPTEGIPLTEIERQALLGALAAANWKQWLAAELLSISPRVMHYKIRKHGITHPGWATEQGRRQGRHGGRPSHRRAAV